MKTPLERNRVAPKDWGARVDGSKVWADDVTYKPTCHIVHYNGGAVAAGDLPYTRAKEMGWARMAESWHLSPSRPGGPMRAIAYNELIGQTGTLYDGRTALHRNGGQWEPWNSKSRATAFILGGTQVPSRMARITFGRRWLEDPLGDVFGHRQVGTTECPGDWLSAWIAREGWLDDLGVWAQGDVHVVVGSIKVRLYRLGYRVFPSFGPKFTPGMRRQVQRFQSRHGLAADGVVGRMTLRAMGGGAFREVFGDDHGGEPTG